MYDNSIYFSSVSDSKSTILEDIGVKKDSYILTTIHRDGNTDVAENMESIFQSLIDIQKASGLEIVLPIHPRTRGKMKDQLSSDFFSKQKFTPTNQ